MKFRFTALALLAVTASVTSAHVLMPAPVQNGASARFGAPSAPSTVVLSTVAAPSVRNALAADAPRSPVPISLTDGRPFVAASVTTWDPFPLNTDAAAPSRITEATAKAAIEADGYRSVRALSRGPDGVWKARALRSQTEVGLSVNATGDVSAN
jgi:hypothetical protein